MSELEREELFLVAMCKDIAAGKLHPNFYVCEEQRKFCSRLQTLIGLALCHSLIRSDILLGFYRSGDKSKSL